MSIVAAFVTGATKFNQPRCSSADEGLKENVVHPYTMGWYSAIKKNAITTLEGKWVQLEIIMLREINQTQTNKSHVLSPM